MACFWPDPTALTQQMLNLSKTLDPSFLDHEYFCIDPFDKLAKAQVSNKQPGKQAMYFDQGITRGQFHKGLKLNCLSLYNKW